MGDFSNPHHEINEVYKTDQAASRTIVAPPSFPWNCPFQLDGQFCHFQCIQSNEPIMPGNPLDSFSFRIRSSSSRFGGRSHSFRQTTDIVRQKCLSASFATVSDIWRLSSKASAVNPYRSCRRAAATLRSGWMPSFPAALVRC